MRKSRKYILTMLVAVGVVAISVLVGAVWVWPYYLFRKAVVHPVPASVKRIKADSSFGLRRHQYVLQFCINKKDLPAILATRIFREVARVKYSDGLLEYGDTGSPRGFYLYDVYEGENPPRWFKFRTSDGFRTYVVEDVDKDFYRADLLLYREDIGQALFIEYEQGGRTALHLRIAFRLLRTWKGRAASPPG